jgi:hypothetical protein
LNVAVTVGATLCGVTGWRLGIPIGAAIQILLRDDRARCGDADASWPTP